MEKKEFTKFEKARIKRTAQNVNQYISKKSKLLAEIEEKQAEVANLQQMIDLSDAPIKLMTGGYGVEQLIRKVSTPTDKLNKNGSIIKQISFEFLYPDTIIPPVEETETTETEVEVEGIIPGEELLGSEGEVEVPTEY